MAKHDEGKPNWNLNLWRAAEKVVRVREMGVKKYGDPDNWQSVDKANERYRAAAMRHLVADMRGEYLDEESGLPHLAHAACNLFFLLEFAGMAEEKYRRSGNE